jgi:preprotein translocase subunit YajC
MFINEAWAQAAGGGGSAGGIEQFLPFVLIIVVFYFLLIRPQQAKAKRHKELIKNVRRGDRVVTQGGLLGTVSKVINDGEIQVEISEGVRVRILRNAITEVLAKTEPAAGAASSAKSSDDASDESSSEDAPPPSPPAPPPGIAGLISRFLGGK